MTMSAEAQEPSPGAGRPRDIRNLWAELPRDAGAEVFTELARGPGVLIERIVSTGQASPPGFWYDQAWDEWVLVLAGEAVLGFESGPSRRLRAGDCLTIPAGCRHRVEWTDPAGPTVWLAVHHGRGADAPPGSA